MNAIPPGKHGGCLPRETKFAEGPFATLPTYGTDGTPLVLPWSEIDALDGMLLDTYHWYTPDQNGLSSCTTGMYENCMAMLREMEGKSRVKFAMAGLYAFDGITIHGDGDLDVFEVHHRRNDGGMNLETALLIAQLQGIPPREIDGVPYVDPLDWQGLRKGRWPGDWRVEAAKYRFSPECYDVPTCQATFAELVHGRGTCRGQDGHAIFQAYKNLVKGTWGARYGGRGDGVHEWGDTSTVSGRRRVNAGIEQYGAFSPRATLPEDAPPSEGIVPPIEGDREEDENRRFRRKRRWGRR